jgi:HSP20 family protein
MDTPGVAERDIELTVHNGELIIQGERKSAGREGGYDGRSYGKFEQRITLPKAVDPEAITAKLTAGVLTLSVPKSEAAKPRKIQVRAE